MTPYVNCFAAVSLYFCGHTTVFATHVSGCIVALTYDPSEVDFHSLQILQNMFCQDSSTCFTCGENFQQSFGYAIFSIIVNFHISHQQGTFLMLAVVLCAVKYESCLSLTFDAFHNLLNNHGLHDFKNSAYIPRTVAID